MLNRRSLLGCAAAALTLVVSGYQPALGNPSHVNYLTFRTTMALPGVTLPAGVYTFEFANPESSHRIVRVSSRDGRKVYFADFARTIPRPANLDPKIVVRLGEAAAGQPIPITAWFPIASGNGYEFVYR